MAGESEATLRARARELARRAGDLLRERGLTLAVAESSTGGLLASLITDVPGSSACFAGALVPYAYRAHETLLGLDPSKLEAHGAVSEHTARAMAAAARARLATDYALAVTGVAGPSGGTEEKPVGLTCLALAGEGIDLCQRHVWTGARVENRLRSALAALDLLVRTLEAPPPT